MGRRCRRARERAARLWPAGPPLRGVYKVGADGAERKSASAQPDGPGKVCIAPPRPSRSPSRGLRICLGPVRHRDDLLRALLSSCASLDSLPFSGSVGKFLPSDTRGLWCADPGQGERIMYQRKRFKAFLEDLGHSQSRTLSLQSL